MAIVSETSDCASFGPEDRYPGSSKEQKAPGMLISSFHLEGGLLFEITPLYFSAAAHGRISVRSCSEEA